MKKMIALAVLMLASTPVFAANVNNSELKIKVYGLFLSTDPLCSNPITVYTDSNPQYQDLVAGPTLFSGNIASGSYPCVILEVSDQWKFKPTSTSGSCSANAEVTFDICPDSSLGGNSWAHSTALDGSDIACTGGEDRIFIYMSIAANGNPDTISGIFKRPISNPDGSNGYNLANAFQVSGSVTSTLTISNVLTNSLSGSGASCVLASAPHFIFH